MMTFEKLVVTDFGTFHGSHQFDFFGGVPGLYFVTGKNEAEPRLGTNGVGKTTLFNAIHWILFGTTARGVKAGDVLTWKTDKKGYSASLVGSRSGEQFEIFRQWNPNKLQLNGKTVSQAQLEEWFGLSSAFFTNSVMIPQHHEFFFDKTPGEKLKMFSDIMGLDAWLDRSDKANSELRDVEATLTSIKTKIEADEQQRERIKQEVDDLESQEAEWDQKRLRAIKRMEDEMVALDTKADRLRDNLVKNQKSLAAKTKKEEEILTKLDSVKKKKTGVAEEMHRVDRKVGIIDSKLGGLRDEKKKFGQVEGTCPYCYQKVSEAHLKREMKRIEDEQDRLAYEKEELLGKLDTLQEDLAAVDVVEQKLRNEMQTIRSALASVESTIQLEQVQIDDIETKISDLEERVADEEQEDNPYTLQMRRALKRGDELKLNIMKNKKAEKDLNKRVEALKYWVSGFKEMRLFLIEETLTQLEVEVNNSLVELGLVDWKITFDVEKQLKSGGISKGFSVMIHSPHNDQPVPWESWSGGEIQRLRVAGTNGFSNLILNSAGVHPNMEVWDEPTEHLSPEGLSDLIDALSHRARMERKQIWLVDQHSMDVGQFVGVLKIVKKKGTGSEIQEIEMQGE